MLKYTSQKNLFILFGSVFKIYLLSDFFPLIPCFQPPHWNLKKYIWDVSFLKILQGQSIALKVKLEFFILASKVPRDLAPRHLLWPVQPGLSSCVCFSSLHPRWLPSLLSICQAPSSLGSFPLTDSSFNFHSYGDSQKPLTGPTTFLTLILAVLLASTVVC